MRTHSSLASVAVVIISTLAVVAFAWAQSPGGAPNPGIADPARINGIKIRTGTTERVYDTAGNTLSTLTDAGTTGTLAIEKFETTSAGTGYGYCVGATASGYCFRESGGGIVLGFASQSGITRNGGTGGMDLFTNNTSSFRFLDAVSGNTIATISDDGTSGTVTANIIDGVRGRFSQDVYFDGAENKVIQGAAALTFEDASAGNDLMVLTDLGTTGQLMLNGGTFQFTDSNLRLGEASSANDLLLNAAGGEFLFSNDGEGAGTLSLTISGSGVGTVNKQWSSTTAITSPIFYDYATATKYYDPTNGFLRFAGITFEDDGGTDLLQIEDGTTLTLDSRTSTMIVEVTDSEVMRATTTDITVPNAVNVNVGNGVTTLTGGMATASGQRSFIQAATATTATNTTPVSITGLAFPTIAAGTWGIHCDMVAGTALATAGIQAGLDFTGTLTSTRFICSQFDSSGTPVWEDSTVVTTDDGACTSFNDSKTVTPYRIDGVFTLSTTGTVTVRLRSETTDDVNVESGGVCTLTQVS